MVPVDMSMEARMVLAKMSFIYEREGGNRIRITRDEDIVTLINYAVTSINKELLKYLDAFVKLLTPSEASELSRQGANIYRGAVVPESDGFPTMVVGQPATAMYRGVAVPSPESQQGRVAVTPDVSHAPVAPVEVKAPGSTKGKRVYRGRVIED
jgi:hypothetical protein